MEASVSPALWNVSVLMSEDLLSASIMRRKVVRSTAKFRSWMVDETSPVERVTNGSEASSGTSFGLRDTRHGCAGTWNTLIGGKTTIIVCGMKKAKGRVKLLCTKLLFYLKLTTRLSIYVVYPVLVAFVHVRGLHDSKAAA